MAITSIINELERSHTRDVHAAASNNVHSILLGHWFKYLPPLSTLLLVSCLPQQNYLVFSFILEWKAIQILVGFFLQIRIVAKISIWGHMVFVWTCLCQCRNECVGNATTWIIPSSALNINYAWQHSRLTCWCSYTYFCFFVFFEEAMSFLCTGRTGSCRWFLIIINMVGTLQLMAKG